MTLFMQDTFTAADGTSLSAHTPDSGGSWSNGVFGSLAILSNECTPNSFSNGSAEHSATAPSVDYSVFGRFVLNTSGWANVIGILGRSSGGNTDAYCGIYDEGSGLWSIQSIAGTGFTVLATSATPTLTTAADVELRMAGTTISLLVNGALALSVSNSVHTSAGKAGIFASAGLQGALALDSMSAGDSGPPPGTHIVSGAGSVAISSPAGVTVALTGIPASVGQSKGNPARYQSIGSIVFGTAAGNLRHYFLSLDTELVVAPVPDATILYYSILPGITATITELSAV